MSAALDAAELRSRADVVDGPGQVEVPAELWAQVLRLSAALIELDRAQAVLLSSFDEAAAVVEGVLGQ